MGTVTLASTTAKAEGSWLVQLYDSQLEAIKGWVAGLQLPMSVWGDEEVTLTATAETNTAFCSGHGAR